MEPTGSKPLVGAATTSSGLSKVPLAIVAIRGVGSLWRFAKYARDNRHLMMTARNDAPKLQPKNTSSAASATSAAALCSPEQRRATGAARLGLPR
jgi:hypothetical protein